jgi:hypothetical protein
MSNMAVLCSFAKTPDRLTTTVHEKLQLGNRISSGGATAAQTHFRIQLQRCEFSGRRLFEAKGILLQAPYGRVTKAAWGGDAGIGMRTASMGPNSREEESKRTIEQELQGAQVETVVIVGAGLAGLATALALHRFVFFLNVQIFCNDDSCLQIAKFIHNVHHIVTGRPDDFPVLSCN